jgi:pectin methylesterase-like acyl-CoA thioesterase
MPWAGSVDTIAELKAIPSQLRQDGFPLLVRSEADWFCYLSGSSQIADDVNVISPNQGTGRWLRSGLFRTRRKLNSSTTIYVSTTGSDSNNGLSAGSPLLTIQAAIDKALQLDIYPYTVVIQIADGVYTAPIELKKVSGNIVLRGNLSNPSSVVIQASNTASVITAVGVENYKLESLRINSLVSGDLIRLDNSFISLKSVVLGSCLGSNSVLANNSKILAENIFIAGAPSTGVLLNLQKYSQLMIEGSVTALANFTVDTVLNCEFFSLADLRNTNFNADIYTVTGKTFNVATNSIITGTIPFGSITGTVDANTYGQLV